MRKRGHAEPANVKVTSASRSPLARSHRPGLRLVVVVREPRLRGCRHLPRRRDADAVERFRHQDRSLVAHSGWNGKFQAVGNGAWQGSIGYAAMAEALPQVRDELDRYRPRRRQRQLGMGHPEKVTDFAYRSEHEMTVTAKAIVSAYGNAPKFSYWTGCSAGGRQAMKAAQMFPGDFDGIIAGSPGLDWSGRTARRFALLQALQKEARITCESSGPAQRGRGRV